MTHDLWLPKGYGLPDGSEIRTLKYAGSAWQVFSTNDKGSALLASVELANRWCDEGILENSQLERVSFGDSNYRVLYSKRGSVLAPVVNGFTPERTVDALAFAVALKESRGRATEVSFHDSVYAEQHSRLLPTWTLTARVDDETVLGTWVSGGVGVSTNSFRRLCQLAGWMSAGDLAEVVRSAGLAVPAEYGGSGRLVPVSPGERDLTTEGTATPSDGNGLLPVREAEHESFILPGRPHLERFFNEHVVDIIYNADRYRALGIEFPSAIVLHGPPGCGKTYAVERLIELLDWPSFSVDSSSVGSPYIHETSKKISETFDQAMDSAPSVIVIDEMESFLSDRRSGGTSGLHHVEEVAEFLRRIPEATGNRVLVIAMTNLIEMIDPAILRRGRFDHIIEVGMPSRIEVKSLLGALVDKLPRADDLDMSVMLDSLTGRPLSDAAFVIREAARIAAKSGKTRLDNESIGSALACIPEDDGNKSRRIGFDSGD